MSDPASDFRHAARLGVVTTLLLFGLIVVGSVVRTTGSGLACPDWPLCQGQLIPPADFHVRIEWLHRLLALLASVSLFATAGWTLVHRDTRARLGGLTGLALLLLLAQIVLGALTVWKLLSPAVVSSHLAVALLLFSSLLVFTLAAGAAAEGDGATAPARPAGLLPLLGGATALVYVQAVLGGVVSTSHAGLACPDWPTCNGRWFPPLQGLEGLQMLHRYGAYAVTVLMIAVAWRTRAAADPGLKAGGAMALGLTLAQVVFGVCNVLLETPVWLTAMHIATAAALLALLVTLTFRAGLGTAAPRAVALAAEAR